MNKTDKENEFDLVNCVQNNDKKFGNSFHDFDSDYSQRCGHGCGLKESDVINSLKAELEKASELIREELENRGIKFKNREDLWDKKAKEFLKREGE